LKWAPTFSLTPGALIVVLSFGISRPLVPCVTAASSADPYHQQDAHGARPSLKCAPRHYLLDLVLREVDGPRATAYFPQGRQNHFAQRPRTYGNVRHRTQVAHVNRGSGAHDATGAAPLEKTQVGPMAALLQHVVVGLVHYG
jgi:hypothetical protein